MQERLLFEYAVIRIVPRVEREEFINVGVILYCSAQKFLQAKFYINELKLKTLCPNPDMEELMGHIRSFQLICSGGKDGGPIGKLSAAERFRWLTATRSTVLQSSKVHPGLCLQPQEMLDKLFEQMVLDQSIPL